MTAAELIEELKKYPSDTPVYASDEDIMRAFEIDKEDIKIQTLPLGWEDDSKNVTGIII
jgi:hypothetical protein